MRAKDMTGKIYGRLTVLHRVDNSKSGQTRWKCSCECGNIVTAQGGNLRSGNTLSCGCLLRDITVRRNMTHGKTNTRLYRTYKHMKERCLNPNNKSYPSYGGRGIAVCDEWLNDYMSFYDWAYKSGYKDDLTIDRKNVNGNYEPSNCRWVTQKIQQNNRSNNHFIIYNGILKTATEWQDITGINASTIIKRVKMGWDVERALFEKVVR